MATLTTAGGYFSLLGQRGVDLQKGPGCDFL